MSGSAEDDLALAVRAALDAGAGVLDRFGGEHDVSYKSPDQPLTAADLEADHRIGRLLRESRPAYGWLSEETADRPDRLESDRVWIVDPIDGTRSFIAGYPEFAISIGLAECGAALLGVVYNPAAGELYWGRRGGGAYGAVRRPGPAAGGRGGERSIAGPAAEVVAAAGFAPPRRLAVTSGSTKDQTILLASRSEIAAGEFDPFAGGWSVRPTGSTAYKMARIAAGAGDVFVSRGPKSEWDVCAGALLISEAGGRATDTDGRPFGYNRRDPYVHGVVASNGRLHDYVLGIVRTLPSTGRLREDRGDPGAEGATGEGT